MAWRNHMHTIWNDVVFSACLSKNWMANLTFSWFTCQEEHHGSIVFSLKTSVGSLSCSGSTDSWTARRLPQLFLCKGILFEHCCCSNQRNMSTYPQNWYMYIIYTIWKVYVLHKLYIAMYYMYDIDVYECILSRYFFVLPFFVSYHGRQRNAMAMEAVWNLRGDIWIWATSKGRCLSGKRDRNDMRWNERSWESNNEHWMAKSTQKIVQYRDTQGLKDWWYWCFALLCKSALCHALLCFVVRALFCCTVLWFACSSCTEQTEC